MEDTKKEYTAPEIDVVEIEFSMPVLQALSGEGYEDGGTGIIHP